VGATALWYTQQYPGALVVAVEPDAANAALCRRNTDSAEVTVIEGAVGGSAGFVELDLSGGADWAVTTQRSPNGTVRIYTIAELLETFAHAEPFLVKMDIEGFELDVFTGNTEWIDRMCAVVVEPHDWMLPGRATSRPFQREMAHRNFDILVCGENLMYLNRDLCPHPPA
jgi:FkbM family methyltransferase